MLKKQARFINYLWRFTDLLILGICFSLAYYLRFSSLHIPSQSVRFTSYLLNLSLILILWLIVSQKFKIYSSKRLCSASVNWKPLSYTLLIVALFYAALGFLLKSLDISRIMLALFTLLSYLVLGFWHQVMRLFLARARSKGYNQRHAIIVGAGKLGRGLKDRFDNHLEFGINILGFFDDSEKSYKKEKNDYEVIGDIAHLAEYLESNAIDRVFITLPLTAQETVAVVTDICEYEGVEVNIVPDLLRFVKFKTKIYDIDGMPVIGVRSTPVDSLQYIYTKRVFDFIFSLLAILATTPILFLAAVVIKLTSSGPVFFKQKRIGVNGREFDFFKLRTMHVSPSNESDTTWTTQGDCRRTKFGAFFRKTCIDELPQFWNVLKGDMSVVGPRPERPYFTKQFKKEVPRYMVRHQVKTGITGWAQVNGLRGDTSIPKRIEHDIFYIENWSFGFDLKIIGLTVFKGINGKNAY